MAMPRADCWRCSIAWVYMSKKQAKKESGKATLAGVKKEMAKPRMAKSARKEDSFQASVAALPAT